MTQNFDFNLENCKIEAEERGLQGDAAARYVEKREPEIYAELERLGMENIRR